MSALLALIPFKDYCWAALVAALLIGFVYERHEGAVHEAASITKATDALKVETAKQTAELKTRATMAEQAYDKERNTVANLPAVQPVRLCNANSGAKLPAATGKVAGNAQAGASAGSIQPVLKGNPAGPDVGPILQALAARADQVSATLREYQNRE
jgi:hypothetical protein